MVSRPLTASWILIVVPLVLAACSGEIFEVKDAVVERGLSIRDAGLDPVDPLPLSRPLAWVDARDADSVVVHFTFDPGDSEVVETLDLTRRSGEDPAGFVRWEADLPPRGTDEPLEYWFEALSASAVSTWPSGAPAERSRVEAEPLVVDFPWPDWPEPDFPWPTRGDVTRVLDGAEDEATLAAAFPFDVIREPIWTPRDEATILANSAGIRGGIGIEVDGQSYFLPLAVMLWNEVANVTLGPLRSGVSYCPLTDTALHFDSGFDPDALPKWHDWAPAGLYNSNLSVGIEGLTAGRASPFNQMLGYAFLGPDSGKRLKPRPSVLVDINVWHRLHPNTLVLEGDPETVADFDYLRRANPYVDYWRDDEEIRAPVARSDDRLPNKSNVFGLLFPDDPVVLPLPSRSDFIHHTRAGGVEVIVLYTRKMAIALQAKHPVTGESMRFERSRALWRETPLFEDDTAEPGLWTMEGVALTGPARGQRLAWVPSMSAFWFAWYAMYPEARFELPEIGIDR